MSLVWCDIHLSVFSNYLIPSMSLRQKTFKFKDIVWFLWPTSQPAKVSSFQWDKTINCRITFQTIEPTNVWTLFLEYINIKYWYAPTLPSVLSCSFWGVLSWTKTVDEWDDESVNHQSYWSHPTRSQSDPKAKESKCWVHALRLISPSHGPPVYRGQ